MTDQNENIREFLLNLPEKYDILEEGIDLQIQNEYISYSETFEKGELTEDQTNKLAEILFDPQSTVDIQKKASALLAHLGSITAFRQIEKFYKICEGNIKQWTALALQECKMFLESDLTGQSACCISSGLGGEHGRLRYYFLLLPATNRPFTKLQKNIIQKELTFVSKGLNSIVESFDLSEMYVGLKILIPLDVAVGSLIEKGISQCNELGDFVFEHYYATNQNIPDKEEIKEIMKIVKDEE